MEPDGDYDGLSSVRILSLVDVMCGLVRITNNTGQGLLVRYDSLEKNSTTEKIVLTSEDMFISAGTTGEVLLIRGCHNYVYVHNDSKTKYPIISSRSSNVGGGPSAITGNVGTPSLWTNYYSSLALQWGATN